MGPVVASSAGWLPISIDRPFWGEIHCYIIKQKKLFFLLFLLFSFNNIVLYILADMSSAIHIVYWPIASFHTSAWTKTSAQSSLGIF